MKLITDTRPEWAKRLGIGAQMVLDGERSTLQCVPRVDVSALEFGTTRDAAEASLKRTKR